MSKAADLLGLDPHPIMMIAAHKGDLRAAASVGFKTGFIPRPPERPNRNIDLAFDDAVDFLDPAEKLGA